jgi:ArsR family transcriptional regulator
LSAAFKALSNPHRLRVFLRLAEACREGCCCEPSELTCCVGELSEGLDIAPSTLSHHLKELHRVGLIRCERSGKNVNCCVDEGALTSLVQFFNQYRSTPLDQEEACS